MNTPPERSFWRRCSTCKHPLDFSQKYWVCNVSTCNRKRTGLVFCSVECWDAHVPLMNHRESWAEERSAPSKEAAEREEAGEAMGANPQSSAAPQMKLGGGGAPSRSGGGMTMGAPASDPNRRRIAPSAPSTSAQGSKEILVVVSKVKDFIRNKADMNTSQEVMNQLSDIVRAYCEDAIRRAQEEGRKTVLDRDIKFP